MDYFAFTPESCVPPSKTDPSDKMHRSMSSMTLAISPDNATRMLEASRAFNIALDRLQTEEEKKSALKNCAVDDVQTSSKMKIQEHKLDAVMTSNLSMERGAEEISNEGFMQHNRLSTETKSCAEMKDLARVSPSIVRETDVSVRISTQSEKHDSSNSDTEIPTKIKMRGSDSPSYLPARSNNVLEGKGLKRKRPKLEATPLPKLLIRAAVQSQHPLLTSYVHSLRNGTSTLVQAATRSNANAWSFSEEEIELCLLLFLDMDKSSKLLTAFEVLAQPSEDTFVKEYNDIVSHEDHLVPPGKLSLPFPQRTKEVSGSPQRNSSEKNDCDEYVKSGKNSNSPNITVTTENISRQNDSSERNNIECEFPQKKPVLLPKLCKSKILQLFQCFLSSISTCIHYEERNKELFKEQPTIREQEKHNLLPPLKLDNETKQSRSKEAKEKQTNSHSFTSEKLNTNGTSGDMSSGRINQREIDTSPNASEYESFSPETGIPNVLIPNSFSKDTLHLHSSMLPSKDWNLSNQTIKEIQRIATYATDHVIEYIAKVGSVDNKKRDTSKGNSNEILHERDDMVSFEIFGQWYNSGGFAIVPWLELLDLAKWDFAGRNPSAAAAVTTGQQKLVECPSYNSQQDIYERDNEIGSTLIKEEAILDPVAQSLSNLPINDKKEYCWNNQKESNEKKSSRKSNEATSQRGRMSDGSPLDRITAPFVSRTIIAFDVTRSGKDIKITEENLCMLKHLVHQTSLVMCTPEKLARVLLHRARKKIITTSSSYRSYGYVPGKQSEEIMLLHRNDFVHCVRELIPAQASQNFNRKDKEMFSNFFSNFFSCFVKSGNSSGLQEDLVNAKELAVGLSFLCSGNKSTKLLSTFELLIDNKKSGQMSLRRLHQYLRSYLTMLVGISLLSSSVNETVEVTRRLLSVSEHSIQLFESAESGATWTLDHFVQTYENRQKSSDRKSAHVKEITFEDFAEWYTGGGYRVAPWLEFLDLKKFLSLLNESNKNSATSKDYATSTSATNPLSIPSYRRRTTSTEVLFTFPLANHHSLVVLREDASYVLSMVKQLGLISMSPEDVWSSIYKSYRSNPPPPLIWSSAKHHKSGSGKSIDVDQVSFVCALENVFSSKNCDREGSSFPKDILDNFFKSFDLDQVNRVAANHLMGGLTLLCEGKKSTKLAFAFGLFDGRNKMQQMETPHSLKGDELFFFLRSFLIVMFSCLKQSLKLSAEAVGRCISNTAQMVMDDVMSYQWQNRKKDRVDFDEFGEWYNEGGFETAPWLELLDLNKWVLLDDKKQKLINQTDALKPHHVIKKDRPHVSVRNLQDASIRQELRTDESNSGLKISKKVKQETKIMSEKLIDCQTLPSDDISGSNTDTFFNNEDMTIDEIDDIDFMFQESNESQDKENELSFSTNDPLLPLDTNDYSKDEEKGEDQECIKLHGDQGNQKLDSNPSSPSEIKSLSTEVKALQFNLQLNDDREGCVISISPQRVNILKQLVTEYDLMNIDLAGACEKIISEASGKMLKNDKFECAMRNIIFRSCTGGDIISTEPHRMLKDLVSAIFTAFNPTKRREVNAKDITCGFSVLCGGSKSDKLEFAFELLDNGNRGFFTQTDMKRYLQSFLTALLSISSCSIGREPAEEILGKVNGKYSSGCVSTFSNVICAGSSWAASQVFNSRFGEDCLKNDDKKITFDEFAAWYTKGGYTSIPWLELLDLRKWVLAEGQ